jgi:alpha-galactosidase
MKSLTLLILAQNLIISTWALNNGIRLPPLGWSSWYGFTQYINETLIREIGDGLVHFGLADVGYTNVWIDDGYALPRDNITHKVTVDPVAFPSGMRNLSDYLVSKGLALGVYTSMGPLTCLGYQPNQPPRPGSCGYEVIDADTYVHDWNVSQVKDDGCGACPQHDPFVAMRDALNATGKPVLFTIHGCVDPDCDFGNVANMWRTGGDLYSSNFAMWTNRLDLATTPQQAALTGPGSLPDPDFLEVGYSPRATRGQSQSPLEQRSMFTMWATLPTGLILSADTRVWSDGLDEYTLETLMNPEIIAINQDPAVIPMRPVVNASGIQVWKRPLASGDLGVVFFFRGDEDGPIPNPPAVQVISVQWATLGLSFSQPVKVRDLWNRTDVGTFTGSFAANITQREARLYKFTLN